jgi:hypothetical protein
MRKLVTVAFAGAVLATGFAFTAVPASADDYRCGYEMCRGDRHDGDGYRRHDRDFEMYRDYGVRRYFYQPAPQASCWVWSRQWHQWIWACGPAYPRY